MGQLFYKSTLSSRPIHQKKKLLYVGLTSYHRYARYTHIRILYFSIYGTPHVHISVDTAREIKQGHPAV